MSVRTDWTNWGTRETWTDRTFICEDRVRDSGGEDPADLHIAYEHAKAQVDAEAATAAVEGEPEYRVYVRVTRTQRERS